MAYRNIYMDLGCSLNNGSFDALFHGSHPKAALEKEPSRSSLSIRHPSLAQVNEQLITDAPLWKTDFLFNMWRENWARSFHFYRVVKIKFLFGKVASFDIGLPNRADRPYKMRLTVKLGYKSCHLKFFWNIPVSVDSFTPGVGRLAHGDFSIPSGQSIGQVKIHHRYVSSALRISNVSIDSPYDLLQWVLAHICTSTLKRMSVLVLYV